MYEAKARVGESSTSFSCDDIRSYHWRAQAISYCFRYQTVASNQAVTDHELFCMPTNKTIGKCELHHQRLPYQQIMAYANTEHTLVLDLVGILVLGNGYFIVYQSYYFKLPCTGIFRQSCIHLV